MGELRVMDELLEFLGEEFQEKGKEGETFLQFVEAYLQELKS